MESQKLFFWMEGGGGHTVTQIFVPLNIHAPGQVYTTGTPIQTPNHKDSPKTIGGGNESD